MRLGSDSAFVARNDGDGGAAVDPFVEAAGWVGAGEGDADASVGGWVGWDGGEAVDEDVAVDLDAPWHGCVLVAGGAVHACLVGTGFEVACGGAAVAAGADVGFEDEPLALPCAEFLFGEIDFGALGCGGDAERAAFPLKDRGGVARVGGGEELGSAGGDEGGGGDEEGAVGELAGGGCGDGGVVEDEAFGGGIPYWGP